MLDIELKEFQISYSSSCFQLILNSLKSQNKVSDELYQ